MSIDMGIRNLAEAVILQSIEDLWDKSNKSDCLAFFKGEGFNIFARIAGIKFSDRMKLLRLISVSVMRVFEPVEQGQGR